MYTESPGEIASRVGLAPAGLGYQLGWILETIGIPRSALVIQAMWPSLRGIGLEEAAIRCHDHPETLSHLTS